MRNIILIIGFTFWAGVSSAQTFSAGYTAVSHSKYRVGSSSEADASDPSKALITVSYFDGLGREVQQLGYRQSPSLNDIILKHTEYDNYGRTLREYLPAPTTQNNGTYKTTTHALATAFYGDGQPYGSHQGLPASSLTGFDNSPLNRVVNTYGAGEAWAANGKKETVTYGAAELDLRMIYELNASGNIIINGSYPAGSLARRTVVNEDGNTTIEVTDRQGKVIRKVQVIGAERLTTYYIYDTRGRLAAVLQPEGYALGSTIVKDSDAWQKYVFAYEYDHRSRIIRKHIPGAGWTEIVYDRADRPVMQQDARQKMLGKWSFTKYETFDRIAFTGETTNTNSRSTLQTQFDTHAAPHEIWMGSGGYNGGSFPGIANPPGTEVQQYYFYDQYDFVAALNPNLQFNASGAYHSVYSSARNRPTGTISYNQDDHDQFFMAASYYDYQNRKIQEYSTHPESTSLPDRTDYQYTFAGEVLQEKKVHRKTGQVDLNTLTRNEYDPAGRVTKTFFKEGSLSEVETIRYSYDGTGRLTQKKYLPNGTYSLGNPDYITRPPSPAGNTEDIARKAVILEPGTLIEAATLNTYLAGIDHTGGTPFSGLQTMDYTWHIRGGLRGINLNGSGNPVPDQTQGDLFSYKLEYETAEQWSGNIGKQSWNHVNGSDPVGVRDYTFTYDAANRLKTAVFSSQSEPAEDYGISNISYDKNGNITQLQRNGKKGSTYGLMDDLTYSYFGNRLSSVNDAVSGDHEIDFVKRGSGAYTYYENGALKSDENKEITNIIYNTYLNKPQEIQLTGGRWVKMTYDGSGALVKREFSTGEYWQYLNGLIYKNGSLYSFTIPDGRAIYEGGNWKYEFFYLDHLGNTRVTFGADGSSLVHKDVMDVDPIGLRLNGTGFSGSPENRFKYQSKESLTLFGLENVLDFSARYFDKSLGRFLGVDAMAEKFYGQSTYSIAGNNTVNSIDPDGNDYYEGEAAQEMFRSLQNRYGNKNEEDDDDDKKKKVKFKDASHYDYTKEVIDGKGKEDWEYFTSGEDGNYFSRAWKLFSRDWKMASTEDKSELVLASVPLAKIGKVAIKGVKVAIPKGFKEVKEFGKSHGQEVYKKGEKYISRDIGQKDGSSHNGGVWKEFKKVGNKLVRTGTLDKNLKRIKD